MSLSASPAWNSTSICAPRATEPPISAWGPSAVGAADAPAGEQGDDEPALVEERRDDVAAGRRASRSRGGSRSSPGRTRRRRSGRRRRSSPSVPVWTNRAASGMWYQSVSARSMPAASEPRVGTIQAAASAGDDDERQDLRERRGGRRRRAQQRRAGRPPAREAPGRRGRPRRRRPRARRSSAASVNCADTSRPARRRRAAPRRQARPRPGGRGAPLQPGSSRRAHRDRRVGDGADDDRQLDDARAGRRRRRATRSLAGAIVKASALTPRPARATARPLMTYARSPGRPCPGAGPPLGGVAAVERGPPWSSSRARCGAGSARWPRVPFSCQAPTKPSSGWM